ncbi:DNA translocase FtsK [Microvirga antarctica]|uniref:DNA translocase FtsK n=1 Tax=Microvirga antarctica TaxID=2819233 RepID=UPI001B30AB88|nr:DNA translocase FtsK [Microvirga antarctica]
MRPSPQPALSPPPLSDSRPTETRTPEVAAHPVRGPQGPIEHRWKTPWSEAGLPEPGWWKAFAVDRNVRSTRTPQRVTADRTATLAKASAIVAAVTKTLEPRPHPEEVSAAAAKPQENPVRHQIADLHSALLPQPAPAAAPMRRQARSDTAPAARPLEEPGSATGSFGWVSRSYVVDILSLESTFSGAEPWQAADVGDAEPLSFAPVVPWDVETPVDEPSVAPALTPMRQIEQSLDLSGAGEESDFLWLYETGATPLPATAPDPDPDPDPEPLDLTLAARVVRPAEPIVTPPTAEVIPFARSRPESTEYELPDIALLAEPPVTEGPILTDDILEASAGRLEKVIRDFGVKGEIIHVRPGPVVTLYEFEPAPGTKSARVIALSDDIARSMSAVSARVAVIPGRNAIGIELPNETRDTVYLREQLESADFKASKQKLPLCLGKTIGGEPVIADLARMPHLLVAGTTGSGKSVAINTMILSLLYRFTPQECRLIMVDPKMLELSVYDGIPHLLTPVVTDPKKAIIALRWAVREMEERYKKMSKLGVRNIDGFNVRVSEAKARGEVITRTVQTGFEKETGQAVYEDEVMDLEPLPYIVVIVDEMADLMMVAGKEIEGAIQRLAQMARAAGIHVVLATQRPSVDVITGTIKANFPTRISFQVTSKIDSRTILGEMGAEQLLGQGDMLYMAGGGRITRVHGPFCSDEEVEKVVAHLKRQAKPVYLEAVTAEDEEELDVEETPVFDEGDFGAPSGDLYDQAVSIVLRHKKASTSYIQRRLQIGYNRSASIMERMEKEGVVGPANHAGKREILMGGDSRDFE